MAICINKSLAAAFWTSPTDSGQMDSGTRAQWAQGGGEVSGRRRVGGNCVNNLMNAVRPRVELVVA